MKRNVWKFNTPEGAYNALQCDERIEDGDILVATATGVTGSVAVAVQAWPVAVRGGTGVFHSPKGSWDAFLEAEPKYRGSFLKAQAEAGLICSSCGVHDEPLRKLMGSLKAVCKACADSALQDDPRDGLDDHDERSFGLLRDD